MVKEPNFFIVGAPKCGTTALASWLADHQFVFMSKVKEPGYFCTDLNLPGQIRKGRTYLQLFGQVTDAHQAVGEASTNYLRSTVAVPRILERRPDARFIVGIRNPVDMARSWHGECVFEGIETERDFGRAWKLQSRRRRGMNVPSRCPDPSLLLYGDVCRLGYQLERLLAWAGREQVFVYLLDDLGARPREVYKSILAFLSLPDDGRTNFPALNRARRVPHWLSAANYAVCETKRRLGIYRGLGIMTHTMALLGKSGNPPVSADTAKELTAFFTPEIQKLERLLGRNLAIWTANLESAPAGSLEGSAGS